MMAKLREGWQGLGFLTRRAEQARVVHLAMVMLAIEQIMPYFNSHSSSAYDTAQKYRTQVLVTFCQV